MIFPHDIEAAIAEFAAERQISREEAIVLVLRDWFEGNGYIAVEPTENGTGYE
ncbi:hypothetical protein J2Y48_004534 [Mycoplana sp. BE70]|uniref:hypothetical protein n=1 Tax=Mycoplana sp. BE70 TaxID=2817775 RepID=UPI00285DF1BA|nr:hypothetical protein [Mycoplana sp. BE70]MDR6759218.1 hypothetical protein [Mycoplana sp. BE70]